MRKLMFGLAAALTAAVAVRPAGATITRESFGTGESVRHKIVVTGETLEIMGSAQDADNKDGCIIDLREGATLKIRKDAANGNAMSVWAYVVATNGAATIDMTKTDACVSEPIFHFGILATGEGSLTVVGSDFNLVCANDVGDIRPVYDLKNVTFQSAGIHAVFKDMTTVGSVPAGGRYEFLNTATEIGIVGANALGLDECSRWTVPCAKVRLMSADAIPASVTVDVPAGRKLILCQADPEYLSFLGGATWANFSWRNSWHYKQLNLPLTFRQSIVLSDASSALALEGPNTLYDGTLSGLGTVAYEQGAFAKNLRTTPTADGTTDLPYGQVCVKTDADESYALRICRPPETSGWRDQVTFWFDASRPESFLNIGRLFSDASENGKWDHYVKADGRSLVEWIGDWRYPNRTGWALWQKNVYTYGDKIMRELYPLYDEVGGPNGLPCFDYAVQAETVGDYIWSNAVNQTSTTVSSTKQSECRHYLYQNSSWKMLPATHVVMVFGTANGGGRALFGVNTGSLQRGTEDRVYTKDDPITLNSSCQVWIDGEQVADPTTTGFPRDRDWQVVSMTLPGSADAIENLGGFKNGGYAKAGGQKYAEAIFFTGEVTDAMRQEAEIYLARKWGLIRQYKGAYAASSVALSGSGSVSFVDEKAVALSGGFGGIVNLDGESLDLTGTLPFDATTLPTNGLVGWFDPSDAAYVTRHVEQNPRSEHPESVAALWNRRLGRMSKGLYLYGAKDGAGTKRAPTLVECQKGFGSALNWMDFGNVYPNDASGNTLRFLPYESEIGGGAETPMVMRTAFVVADSRRGGGTPVQDRIGGDGDVRRRGKTGYTSAIWEPGTADYVTGGDIRLDGADRLSSEGFTGGPEVFSFTTKADFNAGFIGDYKWTEYDLTYDYGEMIGELLFYNRVLEGSERLGVEGYLMNKWLGVLPAGCADYRRATVAGTGMVTVGTLAAVPQFDPAFVGTIVDQETQAPTLSVTLGSSVASVEGGVVAPQADLVLDWTGNPILNVQIADRAYGEYRIVNVKSISRPVRWTVNVMPARLQSKVEIVQSRDGTSVVLKYSRQGLLLFVK